MKWLYRPIYEGVTQFFIFTNCVTGFSFYCVPGGVRLAVPFVAP
jgi:hypothetical protein